jgi:hypothetical protein
MHADAGKRFLSLDETSERFGGVLIGSESVSTPAIGTGGFLLARFEGPDMDGLRAVAVALLVCAATLGAVSVGATQADGPAVSVQQANNASNYLGPNASDVDRSGEERTSLDVGAAVSAGGGQARSTYSRDTLQGEYRSADSEEERRAVVRNGTERLAQRVDALERRETRAVEGYAGGEMTESGLLRVLSTVGAKAGAREETAEWLNARANELGMRDESDRLDSLRLRLVPLQGPVRDDVTEGLDGRTSARVHAEVGQGGVALSTVTRQDGEYVYVREAYDPAIRDTGDTDRYDGDFAAVYDRLAEIYPWVTENNPSIGGSDRVGSRGERLYSMSLVHDHGELRPYLDGGTGRVVGETQRNRVEQLPTTTVNGTSESGDLRVQVETTHPGGPLGVTVVDEPTGERLDAVIMVDGDPVGSTGGERLWTVAPRGETTVNATHQGETVTVEITVE